MAYPATKFTIVDNSDIEDLEIPAEDNLDRPVYMCVIASDKGYEEWKTNIMGQKFYDIYGTPSFAKYGQESIQAANIINNGGRLAIKRVVADNAKLAHIVVVAHLWKDNVQMLDSSGNPIYIDSNGDDTINPALADVTLPNGGAKMEQKCKITYTYHNINMVTNNLDLIKQQALADYGHTAALGEAGDPDSGNENGASYPLFVITETGRGESTKSFRIHADTSTSRPVDYVKYILNVYENGSEVEQQMAFTLNPDIIELGKNISLQTVVTRRSNQIRCRIFEDEIKAFMENAAYIANIDYDEYKYYDVLFGTNLYGKQVDKIIIDNSAYNMSSLVGISLVGGENGDIFTDGSVVGNMSYYMKVNEAFNGSFDDIIYDLDNFRIDFVFDANYPEDVKRTIENLVEFREDCFFFRDMGTGLTTLSAIKQANIANKKSRLCATYENSWDIIDPFTKKQITVTATYNLAGLMVNHFMNGRNRPFCGLLYAITFPDVIEGTVNFTPKNTPSEDQKQEIDDIRINYASYYNGLLTMETEYTSQERLTQLSWLNNILTLQQLIKDIRLKCPKIRYNFLDTESLQKYQDDVQSVIDNYNSIFESIRMEYVADSTYENNKIFYAVIEVKMKNFIQSEYFKITVVKS